MSSSVASAAEMSCSITTLPDSQKTTLMYVFEVNLEIKEDDGRVSIKNLIEFQGPCDFLLSYFSCGFTPLFLIILFMFSSLRLPSSILVICPYHCSYFSSFWELLNKRKLEKLLSSIKNYFTFYFILLYILKTDL